MRKVINIAHRGYHRDFPENTLEAFEAAMKLGVDGIEFDVQETADGGFFVHHDDDINGRNIAEMKSPALRKVRLKDEYAVPELEEVLQVCGKEIILLVELKQVRSLDNFLQVLRLMADIRLVVLLSFDPGVISKLDASAPEMMKAVIGQTANPEHYKAAGVVGMRYDELDVGRIDAVHAGGGLVFAWDCTDAGSVHHALDFEIDGIISDHPDIVIREALHEN